MSDQPAPPPERAPQEHASDHLIERAAARLRKDNVTIIPTSAAAAAATKTDAPPPAAPPGRTPFRPFTLQPAQPIVTPETPKPTPQANIPTKPTIETPRPAHPPLTLPGTPPTSEAASLRLPPNDAAPPTESASALPVAAPTRPPLQPAPPGLRPVPRPTPQTPEPIDFASSLPEAVPGPIPTPGRPLTRPIQTDLPSALKLGAARLSTQPQPARAGIGPTPAHNGPPIVQLDALERAGMVVARTTRTRISEEYRIAIGRILRTLHETTDVQGARNVLMVTSARPGEGKSFTALNLAGSIAQNGTEAVLLVDVDPKVKPLSDQLGLGEANGFLDLVSDPSLRPEDLLRITAIPNLAIMPVGTRLGGAAQTAGGTASMRPIIPTITRLARRFPKHLIMLDAPPCLSTSDPHTLAPHVGQVVLVVEAERTQRNEVEAAIDLIRVCPSITMLLNKVRMTTSHTFGAYDYFGSYT